MEGQMSDIRSRYFLSLIPFFLVPSAATYLGLRLLHEVQPTVFPSAHSWVAIVACIFARPAFFFLQWYYTKWIVDRWEARKHGAVLPPHIKETAVGIIPELISSTRVGYPGNMIYQWGKIYGNTYQFSLLTNRIVVTFEPEHVKAILATQFEAFEKGPTFISQLSSMLGSGVFNADGEMWRRVFTSTVGVGGEI
ncbi:hypothetical protein D9613_011395 [Agrocybe pediades]|uniref:Cytochrome P450 n=1 Tax=Agrocybe pediades TaxID=84607 RepID=A0A8H4QRX3_9AGAR|nr:hypothetical protein D9613_011395 [Agrocybe pediades]